ncbi:MAG TPA: response regulator [Rhodothermales bacterium]|nr:response regulator [Rhodothermales bacterium]
MVTSPLLAPLHVLVADDNADMRLYLTGCLRGFGLVALTVTEAANGREALLLARTLAFDLIISDVVMPGLDGLALCRALRADAELARIPVLLISGAETQQLPDVGANAFLAKPFNAEDLRVCLLPLLHRPP